MLYFDMHRTEKYSIAMWYPFKCLDVYLMQAVKEKVKWPFRFCLVIRCQSLSSWSGQPSHCKTLWKLCTSTIIQPCYQLLKFKASHHRLLRFSQLNLGQKREDTVLRIFLLFWGCSLGSWLFCSKSWSSSFSIRERLVQVVGKIESK